MTRWPRGEAEIEELLRGGHLQQVTGAQTDGQPFLDKARRVLTTATGLVGTDPESAYVLAYDAARHAATALLAHQGLRATSKGGHYAVDVALRAQFGAGFRSFSALRRRRNELEYPENPAETIDADETQQAVSDAGTLIDAASRLLPTIGRWDQYRPNPLRGRKIAGQRGHGDVLQIRRDTFPGSNPGSATARLIKPLTCTYGSGLIFFGPAWC